MNTPVIDRVVEQLKALLHELQWRVLDFTQTLRGIPAPRGIPGRKLLGFAGVIPADDLRTMRQAIEDGCEQVDSNEW
jgi:hypothetical protein